MKNKILLFIFSVLIAQSSYSLNPGDIAFVQYNADNPDNIAFVALVDIPSGTEIKFTDNGWKSSGDWRDNEGVHTWTAPSNISAGDVITITLSGPQLSASGDQIIAYQNSDDMIAALNNEGSGVWQADATSSNTSALPDGLTNGTNAVALDEIDNAVYTGTTTGDKATLLAAINDKANWTGDDGATQTFSGSFTVTGGADTDAPVLTFSPTDGATNVPVESNITLSFDEAILEGDGSELTNGEISTYVTLNDGSSDVTCNYTINATKDTITLDPTSDLSTSTTYTVTLTANAVEDAAGNQITTEQVASFTTEAPDLTAPVVSFSPADGATNVPVSSNITLSFDEAVLEHDGSELTNGEISTYVTLNDGSSDVACTYTINATKDTITLDPNSDLSTSTTYTVTLTANAVEDAAGNQITTEQVASFTTSSTVGPPPASDLFFSEYAEGSSNNKYIEIYNGTGGDVDLSNYSVELYTNGSSFTSSTETLTGTLADGDVYVIYNGSAAAGISSNGDLSSGVAGFNGNDAVVLKKNTTIIDIIGNIGCDPGSAWTADTHSTEDMTLVRNATVSEGVGTDPADSPCEFPSLASQWAAYPTDTWTDIGTHTYTGDLVPPVLTFSPTDGATNVPVESNITLVFDEAIEEAADDSELLNSEIINYLTITDGSSSYVSCTFSIDADKKVITADPVNNLNVTVTYTVTLTAGAVQDTRGNVLASEQAISFTVEDVDVTAPVVSFSPADGATNVAVDGSITISFDEAVRNIDDSPVVDGDLTSLVTLKETDGSGTDVPFSGTVSFDKQSFTITPSSMLSYNQAYYVAVNNVEDINDNAISLQTASFTTRGEPRFDSLIISEVVAGTNSGGAPKYVEIYNASSSSYDLSDVQVRRYANGNLTSSDVNITSGTNLAAGETWVVAGSQFESSWGGVFATDTANQISGIITGNGDDVYELYDNGQGDVIDVYGVVGTDGTGEAWEYTSSIAYRNDGVLEANAGTFDMSEWTILPYGNDSANAGQHPFTLDGGGSGGDSDTDAPTVTIYPADAATGIAVSTSMIISFNEAIEQADGTELTSAELSAILSFKQGSATGTEVSFTATINTAKDSITISPDADLASGTTYYVALAANSVQDTAGNKVATLQSATFTTAGASNTAPVASNVAISGTLAVGDTLTGTYTYTDAESDVEGSSTYKWYRAADTSGMTDILIATTSINYVPTGIDDGKYIVFEVTPVAATGTTTGTAVKSSYYGPVGATAFEVENSNALRVYPNPTEGLVRIELEGKGIDQAIVLDMNGRSVLSKDYAGQDKAELDLGGLPAGTYQLLIIDIAGKISAKAIILN